MRVNWMKDRVQQGQFHVYWESNKTNLGDLPTKHHYPSHHMKMRPLCVYEHGKSPSTIQGCVNIMRDAYAKKPRPAHKLKLLASPTDTGEPPARSATKKPAKRNLNTPLKRIGSQFTGALRRPHVYPIYL